MDKNKVDLSIIILNYNSGDFLKECVQSIEQSELDDIGIEVIVVDNASTDGSMSYIKNQKSKIKNLKIIENKKNLGFSAGNNVGVKEAKGEYVLFLNPDTVLTKNTLKDVYKFMEENQDVGVSTARLELADGALDEASHRGFPTPWNAFCHFSGLEKIFAKSKLFSGYTMGWLLDKKEPHEVDAISGAFFFVRRKAAEEVGFWDEDFFWYGEDLDFPYRLKMKGWKIMFLPNIKILHYRGVSSGIKKHTAKLSAATAKTRMMAAKASTEAMRIFYEKHYKDKYPRPVTWFVLLAINLLEKIRVWRVTL